jgi:hypothetical protein
MSEATIAATCNLCGLSCVLGCEGHPASGPHGLVGQAVYGGYESTPGNGHGALDDMTSYRFSLCEWCLDWLFQQFKAPVEVREYSAWDASPIGDPKPFVPAEGRVNGNPRLSMRREFFEEKARRDAARSARQ